MSRVAHAVGDTLDRRYALKRLIASSDGALLFEADHTHLARTVAVRLLSPEASRDARARAALLAEARLLDRARHPGVLRVVDVAETSEREPYLATAPITGRPLDGVLAVRGALTVEEAIAVTVSIGDALAHAHSIGSAHAGLCASSVMLSPGTSGAVRARASAPPGTLAAILLDVGVAPGPTSTLAGPLAALGYAAPERLKGSPPDPASDAHALGALLFEMLTGELPRSLESAHALPPPLLEVVRRALAPRESRFAGAAELVSALRDSTTASAIPVSIPPPRRRAHARAGYVTPVRVRRPNGQAVDGRTEDISEGGLLLLINADVATGESLLVRFALPMTGRIVSVPAQARWIRETRGEARACGLQFVDPGDKVLEDIRAYVAFLGEEP